MHAKTRLTDGKCGWFLLQFRDKLKKLRELSDYQGRCKKLRERLEQTSSEHLQKTGCVVTLITAS